jgi:hypothetical protein
MKLPKARFTKPETQPQDWYIFSANPESGRVLCLPYDTAEGNYRDDITSFSMADIENPTTVYTGFFKASGCERIQVDFEAPAGATTMELDAAFFAALCKIEGVESDYLAMGESA